MNVHTRFYCLTTWWGRANLNVRPYSCTLLYAWTRKSDTGCNSLLCTICSQSTKYDRAVEVVLDFPYCCLYDAKKDGRKVGIVNLLELPKLPLSEELVTVLAQGRHVRVERIVSTGQTSDWYDQQETEFVALLQGEAGLTYENGETITLRAGDTLIIPPRRRHRLCYTSSKPPCIWLCVFWEQE